MKFQFEDQPHQAEAVAAVVDLFNGVLKAPAIFSASGGSVSIDRSALAQNLSAVTLREKVGQQTKLVEMSEEDFFGEARLFPNFSVEMETGTGKTFVYIATALRLAELYGLKKFVIVVHSLAIRAGVVKTLEQTAEYFSTRYPSVAYKWGVLGQGPALDDFLAPSGSVQFLIASIQAIDKPEKNAVYQNPEQPQLWGEPATGISATAALSPVVLIDEPQNMVSELRRKAIASLNPLFALRYSATHREPFNLVHRLGPKAASEAGLVKRVSVKGVVAGATGAYVRIDKVRAVRSRLMVDATIDVAEREGASRQRVVLQNGTDLEEESAGLAGYRGWVVERISRKPDQVFFENGRVLSVGDEIGVDKLSVWRDQVRHVIRQHIYRQDQIDAGGQSIKVLSLFFVERVADYVGTDATLPAMFDSIFRSEWARAGKAEEDCPDPEHLRTSYFPSTKTGILKDTSGRASDADAEERAYQEIVAHKELLLEAGNPRSFIFSHSALKEGWDNPNVFQVGFLRHSKSDLERRQQIGRGLRLPVNADGKRVSDPAICKLTLVVDETFADFREALNAEFAKATGGSGGEAPPPPENLDTEIVITRRPKKFGSGEFGELWNRIRYKARYRVTLDHTLLPEAVASSEILEDTAYLAKRANVVQSAEVEFDEKGRVITSDEVFVEGRGESLSLNGSGLPDLVRLIEDQLVAGKNPLQLTRPTIGAILQRLPKEVKRRAINDPQRWCRIVADAIRVTSIEQLVNSIHYEPLAETEWWDAELVFLETETVNPPSATGGEDPSYGAVAASAGGNNLFDHLVYDSHVERNFGSQLESMSSQVPLFTKLPRRFRVSTPVGDYSPDWAILYRGDGGHKLVLVRETKDTLNLRDLEWDEAMRIRFAGRHFAAKADLPVDFVNTTDKAGLRIAEPLS
ncbi:DEAD/DEAH box helicase family protein [Sphingomonas sp.]|uniref:restriction endonuclease n=1 Tax=Sphingomonas sp. TaxID=28214 RepID=UPI0035C80250